MIFHLVSVTTANNIIIKTLTMLTNSYYSAHLRNLEEIVLEFQYPNDLCLNLAAKNNQ